MAAAALAVVIIGCGRRDAQEPAARKWRATVQTSPAAPGFQVVRVDDTATSIAVTLRWPAGAPDPESIPPLIFCLPENRPIDGHIVSASLGGQPVEQASQGKSVPIGPLLGQRIQVEPAGYLRHWPLYRCTLPMSIFEATRNRDPGKIAQDLDIVLQLAWNGPENAPVPPAFKLPDNQAERYWRRMAEALVANKTGLDRHAVAAPPMPAGLTSEPTDPRRLVPGERPWARIRIDRDGLYRIGRDELIRAGIASEKANPDQIRIFSRGTQVPLIRAAAGDGSGLATGVYFCATGETGPYTRERIYWLTLDAAAPDAQIKAIPTPAEALPEISLVRRHYRRDRDEHLVTLHGRFLAVEAIRWIETALRPSEDVALPIELPDYAGGAEPLRAHFEFLVDREVAAMQPRIEVRAGNRYLGTMTLNNFDQPRGTVELPPAAFADGRATLTLRMIFQQAASIPDDIQDSGLWLDRIDIDYNGRARLEKGRLMLGDDSRTSSAAWIAVEGTPILAIRTDAQGEPIARVPIVRRAGRLCVPRKHGDERIELFSAEAAWQVPLPELADLDNLADPKEGADLLIVSHKDFEAETQRLAKYHRDKGWRVRVASVQSVYDSFSDGEFTPIAIRRMMAYAMRKWQGGAPAVVLLVGDCNSDYLDEARQGIRNWVPTYTFSYGGDQWASDYWFTIVCGEDDLGDCAIGRIPVTTASDLKQIVDKLIAYESAPQPGPWRSRLGYISDDGEFPEVLDGIRKMAPAAMGARRVFLNEMPLEDNWYLPRTMVERKRMKVSRETTDAILDTFRGGVSWLTYYGHGSPNIWAEERIWFGGDSKNSDNIQLANLGRPAFVACMTCNSGMIDYPERPWNICISEDMLRVPNGGAIGLFVPSGPGVTYIHRQMSETLSRILFSDRMRGMGEVTTLAKLRYSLAGQPRELVYMYVLLGDPLIDLQLIDEWAKLDLKPGVIAPGGRAKIALDKVPIDAGKWLAQLVRGDESVVWQSSGAIEGGRISFAMDCPTTTTACEATLRIQAWGDTQGWSAAGAVSIQRPVLKIADLRVESGKATVHGGNPGKISARGGISMVARDRQSTRSLGVEEIELAAGAKKDVSFPLAGQQKFPATIVARLKLPSPPDDPGLPRESVLEKPIAGPAGTRGWVPGSLQIERETAGLGTQVTALAQVNDKKSTASLHTRDGRKVVESALVSVPGEAASIMQARFSLNRTVLDQLAGGSIRLNAPGAPAITLPLGQGRVIEPRLRIVPGSIRWRPRRPTDGQTIFVSCEVENAGDAPSIPCGIELRKAAPGSTESLPDAMGQARRDVPRLAPGRRVPIEMRWDPFNNAGHNQVRIALESGAGAPTGQADQVASIDIEALTKAAFKVNKVWAEAGHNDLLANRMNFKANISNNGQTEARHVMVSFYRGATQTPESEVGQIELDRVAGNTTIEARFVWNFKPGIDYTEGAPLPEPTARVWLRGSTQRFSSTAGEVND